METFMFQYNDCLGSSNDGNKKEGHLKSFNTTIVWVRQKKEDRYVVNLDGFQYNDCLGSS